jgi:hypothetical protein
MKKGFGLTRVLAVPQPAVVFYNDCCYIAHHLLSLGFAFKQHLPADVAAVATFVDLVSLRPTAWHRHRMHRTFRWPFPPPLGASFPRSWRGAPCKHAPQTA